MALSNIITECRSAISELDANNSHFTDAELTVWINEAIRFIITRLEELPVAFDEITSATGDIDLSTKTLLVNEAYILNPDNSKYEPLKIIDFSGLKYISPTWLSDGTDVPAYLARKGTFHVYLYPQPKTTYIGQNIKLAGVDFPVDLSSSTDVPDLPQNVQDWIPHYVAYKAFPRLHEPQKSVDSLILLQGLIKSSKSISTKFSNEAWRIVDDN
jgi:hypothetical protein